jgi:hypothetical protein
MPRAHPFYTLSTRWSARDSPRPCRPRDLLASSQILKALGLSGFSVGTELLDGAPAADTSDCSHDDLIVTAGRLSVGGGPGSPRGRMAPSDSDLMGEMLDLWCTWLPVFGRDRVILHPELSRMLPPRYENRFDMSFSEEVGARYRRLRSYDDADHRALIGMERRTAAFLLRVPRLPRRDVGYLGVWSPDAISSLVWATLLRHVHAELLCEPGFVLAELVQAPLPARPTDLRWALDWRAEILLRVPLASAPEGSRATL